MHDIVYIIYCLEFSHSGFPHLQDKKKRLQFKKKKKFCCSFPYFYINISCLSFNIIDFYHFFFLFQYQQYFVFFVCTQQWQCFLWCYHFKKNISAEHVGMMRLPEQERLR